VSVERCTIQGQDVARFVSYSDLRSVQAGDALLHVDGMLNRLAYPRSTEGGSRSRFVRTVDMGAHLELIMVCDLGDRDRHGRREHNLVESSSTDLWRMTKDLIWTPRFVISPLHIRRLGRHS